MPKSLRSLHFRAPEAPDVMALGWRLRHRVFNDNLGWEIPERDLLEIDDFDSRALHGVVFSGPLLAGYVRALPTTEPYLLSEHFPQLLDGPPPRSPDVVEISRFCVDPQMRHSGVQRRLVREGVAIARTLGARTMIAVTEPPFERFLKSCGLRIDRLCPPQTVGEGLHGRIRALVIRCDLTVSNLSAVGLTASTASTVRAADRAA